MQSLFTLVTYYHTALIVNLCTILCQLDTLHPQLFKISKETCNLQQFTHSVLYVQA